MTILRVSGLKKSYRSRTVLDGFSLRISRGQIHGILGPNGSGKSTSLHAIVGLIKPDAGNVEIAHIPVDDKKSRNHFGFAPDDLPLPAFLTGKEFLLFHDSMRCIDTKDRCEILIETMGLNSAIQRPIAEYSHGMKRKIQLVAALAHEPDLLILDEPFRGLDPEAAAILQTLLRTYTASGRAVLIATHDMLRAQRDCDGVTILSGGVTVSEGEPRELIANHPGARSLEDVFLRVTGSLEAKTRRQHRLKDLFTPVYNKLDQPIPNEGDNDEVYPQNDYSCD